MRFIETSAKTSANVEEAFVTMTKEIIREREAREAGEKKWRRKRRRRRRIK